MGPDPLTFQMALQTGKVEVSGQPLVFTLLDQRFVFVIHEVQGGWVLSDSVSGYRVAHLGYEANGTRQVAKHHVTQLITDIGPESFVEAVQKARQDSQGVPPADPECCLSASG